MENGQKSFLRKIGLSLSGLATLATIIGLNASDFQWKELFFLPDGGILHDRLYIFIIAILTAIFFGVHKFRIIGLSERFQKSKHELNERYKSVVEDLNAKQHELELKVKNLRSGLHDMERERLTDLVTGIPNQLKLEKDIFFYSSVGDDREKTERKYQLIYIDIENFGVINKKHGHLKGDEVIRLIARRIYETTRRDEHVYKKSPLFSQGENVFMSRAYRTYKGGDEFVMLLNGMQFEAVGLLNRLSKEMGDISAETVAILGEQFDIKFTAAVSQLYRGDNYRDAMSRLETHFTWACERKDGLGICWDSDEEDIDLQSGSHSGNRFIENIYKTARSTFARNADVASSNSPAGD
ncbi:MAG: hypothetical protein Tsb002_03220 [Wenzhouxiangellaceae bacterium]